MPAVPHVAPEARFRALNSARVERLRALLEVPARAAFDALPGRLNAAAPAGAIAGIYAMGSAGTIGHGPDSDLDLWIVTTATDDPVLADVALDVSGWCRGEGLDLRAFLVDPHEFRAGNRTLLAGDDCGSTQDRLLLDEFYRTAVLLDGQAPVWWLIAPDDEAHYDALAPALAGEAYLDLGSVGTMPDEEFLGATLWHLHKALTTPHKSLLKLLLLESYALQPGESLALEYKRQVYAGCADSDALDPYLLLYRRIERYLLSRGDARRLELARLCLWRKAGGLAGGRKAGTWQDRQLRGLCLEWGWSAEVADRRPDVGALLAEHGEIARQLDYSHTLLRQWTDAMPHRFAADRDLRLLEADLAARTLAWPGKVPVLNVNLRRRLAQESLLLTEVDGQWRVATADGHALMRDASLVRVLCWALLNEFAGPGAERWVEHPWAPALLRELEALRPAAEIPTQDLLAPPAPRRELLLVTDAADWTIERVAMNSWGEVSTRTYHGLEELSPALSEFDGEQVDVRCVSLPGQPPEPGLHLGRLLAPRRPVRRVVGMRTLLENGAGILVQEHGGNSGLREFADLDALFAHLRERPLPVEILGSGPLLAPCRALQAAWLAAGRAPGAGERAHALLLSRAANEPRDAVLLLDRDGALVRMRLGHRAFPRQQDALRLFLANVGRRSRIATTAWTWGHALQPLRGRVYLPERVGVTLRPHGGYDLDCAGQVFADLPHDGAALQAARACIRQLRRAPEPYPMTVTDVLVPDPATAFMRDLLAIKIEVEDLLNRVD